MPETTSADFLDNRGWGEGQPQVPGLAFTILRGFVDTGRGEGVAVIIDQGLRNATFIHSQGAEEKSHGAAVGDEGDRAA